MTDELQTRDPSTSLAAGSPRRRASIAMLMAIVCLGIRWPLLAQPGFVQDQVYFLHWASMAERGGVAAVYDTRANGRPWCNYPPLYPYVLHGLAGVYRMGTGQSLDAETIGDVIEHRVTPRTAAASALFKMPAVIADGVTCALLVLWLSRRVSLRTAGAVSLAYAVMPAVVFDSAVWGQVDSIPTLLTLAALECTTRCRWTWVGVFMALAGLAKPQALLFVPIYLAASIFSVPRQAAASALRLALGALVVVILLIAPLWSARANIVKAYSDAAGYYPYVHLNGFSAWFLANPLAAPRLDELTLFYKRDDQGGATPRLIGLAVLGIMTAAMLLRVVRLRASPSTIGLAARVLPLAFMVLCTQMHERYLVPAIACWAWAYRPSRFWWIGWLTINAVAIVNLLWVWEQPLVVGAATSIAEWTRSSPGGIPTGVYCAIALIAVLLMSLTDFDRPTPKRKITA